MLKSNLEKIFAITKKPNDFGEKITVVGATKTMDVQIINEAINLGLKVVAENRVQEFLQKHALLSPNASQHFIGHLQTNKVKYLVGNVDIIQSVDSLRLAEEINRVATNRGIKQKVLIEINVGGEKSKSGFRFESAIDEIYKIKNNCPNLVIKGLMTMLPNVDDKSSLVPLCVKMRALYDRLRQNGFDFEYLSMGTSGDFEVSIQNGSNMIRLGRTIFGERKKGEN